MSDFLRMEEFTGVEVYVRRKTLIAKLRVICLWRLLSGQELPEAEARMEMHLNHKEKVFGIIVCSFFCGLPKLCERSQRTDPVEAQK